MRQLKITQSITNRRESHTLEKYFTEVSGVPMITPEEEVRLAKEIKKGNQDALDKLVCRVVDKTVDYASTCRTVKNC